MADVFDRPAHPYTRALLDAIAVPGDGHAPLRGIEGHVPSASAWPEGCRFRPRCPLAFARCIDEPEPIALPGEGRSARCWLAGPSVGTRAEDLTP